MNLLIILAIGLMTLLLYSTSSLKGYIFRIFGFGFIKTSIFSKDGKKIVLAGMSHVASASFYKNIHKNYKMEIKGRKSCVLFEGVTDNQNILNKKTGKYDKLGKVLNLKVQNNKELFDNSDMIHSDVDASSMNPTDIKLINYLFSLIQTYIDASEYTDKELKEFYLDPSIFDKKKFKEEDLDGLIYDRNEHLFKVFLENESKYEVFYIPWGAKHLPDIQNKIEKLGYKEIKSNYLYGFNSFNMIINLALFVLKVQFFQSNVRIIEKKK